MVHYVSAHSFALMAFSTFLSKVWIVSSILGFILFNNYFYLFSIISILQLKLPFQLARRKSWSYDRAQSLPLLVHHHT